jgi:hypothetical protein
MFAKVQARSHSRCTRGQRTNHTIYLETCCPASTKIYCREEQDKLQGVCGLLVSASWLLGSRMGRFSGRIFTPLLIRYPQPATFSSSLLQVKYHSSHAEKCINTNSQHRSRRTRHRTQQFEKLFWIPRATTFIVTCQRNFGVPCNNTPH